MTSRWFYIMLLMLNYVAAFGQVPTRPVIADVPESYSFDVIKDIAAGENQFVAVGSHGLILTTNDGRSWTTRHWTKADSGNPMELRGIAWGDRRYIAIASNGSCLSSADGVTWSDIVSQGLQGWLPVRIHSIDNNFYIIGNARTAKTENATALFISSDCRNWRPVQVPPGLLADVAGGDGALVLLMRNGLVYKSTGDGRWQDSKDLLITGVFKGGENHRLAWSGTTYVALQERGWGSVLGTSKDGYAWTHKTFEGYNRLYDSLIWNGKVFVAAGYGSVTVSADGSNWQFVSLRNGKAPIRDALSIAGSNGNTILVSMAQEEQKSNERKPASFIAVLLGSADGLAWQGVLDGASLPKLGSGREYVFSEVTTKTLTELEETKSEHLANTFSSLAIGFTMSGLGLFAFVGLQIASIHHIRGRWRFFAWLPAVLVILVIAFTIYALVNESNLWPVMLIFTVPVALIYLIFLNLVHFIYVKGTKRGRADGSGLVS